MSERFVVSDDRGGIWFAVSVPSGGRRIAHAPQGKRFWHEGDEGFAEADLGQVLQAIELEGRTPSGFVDIDEVWESPPEPEEDPRYERIIGKILGGMDWSEAGAGVLSTSEAITVALATGLHEELPPGYRDPSDAWERLDAIQQGVVRRHVPDEEAGYHRDPAPRY